MFQIAHKDVVMGIVKKLKSVNATQVIRRAGSKPRNVIF